MGKQRRDSLGHRSQVTAVHQFTSLSAAHSFPRAAGVTHHDWQTGRRSLEEN
jgi:hypothetical protein